MRIAVIGAGAVGASTARFLANEGHAPIVFEQFAVDHDRGSSFGSSRIYRSAYTDAAYTALMGEALPLWRAMEHDAGERLRIETGGLFFGEAHGSEMPATIDALRTNGVAFDTMTMRETARRFPQFRLRESEHAVFEPSAGLLRASVCVRAAARLAVRAGAVLREHTAVTRVERAGDALTLTLATGESVPVDRLVVTAGPWTARVLPSLASRLSVSRQAYCHFQPASDPSAFEVGRCPVWIDMDALYYGFPHDGVTPGVKIARHGFGSTADASTVDRALSESDRAPLREYARERIPSLSERVVYEKVCLYTNTPDTDFVVDYADDDRRISVVAGLSGHGFKFAVLLGRIAAWMATDQPVPYDLARFSRARFGA